MSAYVFSTVSKVILMTNFNEIFCSLNVILLKKYEYDLKALYYQWILRLAGERNKASALHVEINIFFRSGFRSGRTLWYTGQWFACLSTTTFLQLSARVIKMLPGAVSSTRFCPVKCLGENNARSIIPRTKQKIKSLIMQHAQMHSLVREYTLTFHG